MRHHLPRIAPLILAALGCAPTTSAQDPFAGLPDASIDAALQDARSPAPLRDLGSTDAGTHDAALIDAAALPDAQTADMRWTDAATQDAGLEPRPLCATTGPTPLRRLTPVQYRKTALALGLPAIQLNLSAPVGPVISQLGAERFSIAAAALAGVADVSVAGVLPCDPFEGEAICGAEFIATFADAALRRAPTAAEIEWLSRVWDAAPDDFEGRARLIIEVVLQSPQVLYRFESHVAGALNPAAQAERLAFALTDAPPDARLRAADLTDPATRAAEARRLATSAAGRDTLRRFILRWADVDHIGEKVEAFPNAAALAESAAFVDRLISQDGTFADLMTDRGADLAPEVAALYGQPAGRVDLPEDERAGLLTRLAFLAAHAGPVEKSPIQRGVFVRAQLLCGPLPPPPPTVDNTPIQRGGRADDGRARSIRQFTAIRTAGRDCAGCHDLINPAGFVFGQYDARGRFGREESGVDRFGDAYVVPVDAQAELVGADFDPSIADAVALSEAVAGSDHVHDCFVEHWLRAVLARDLTRADDCDLQALQDTFTASGGRLSTLMTATAQLAAMRLKQVEEE
ncbi:MAG: hypothetical protein ACI9U2_000553 [Bradymonadia bacterium]